MSDVPRNPPPGLQELPDVTLRQLEVFSMVCREKSFANAALELRGTRTNIKRVCDEFQKSMGRPLFEDGPDRSVIPTPFAQALFNQVPPLARSLHRLDDCVKALHASGRILRFGAAGELFKGGIFTGFLGRLRITDIFRPCFLRIESQRFQTALLNSECDAYFGIGLATSERLEIQDLEPIPWRIGGVPPQRTPRQPSDLGDVPWAIVHEGDPGPATMVLEAFRTAGACGGELIGGPTRFEGVTFMPDPAAPAAAL